jgi:hypothetical protein
MRKVLMTAIFILAGITMLQAQYSVNWINYSMIDVAGDKVRGAAYNRVTDHVLIASRKYGVDVFVYDAATGDSLGKLNTAGISGGTYAMNLVSAADDGTVYVCNLSAPMFTPNSTFRVYRYANEGEAPELVFDGDLGLDRYGDSFRASGSGTEKYIYASGLDNSNMIVLHDDGSAQLTLDATIALPQMGNARHGISPVTPNGKVWVNGVNTGSPPPRLLNFDGTLISTVPDSFASAGGTSTIQYMGIGKYNVISLINAFSATVRSVKYAEDQLGTVTYEYFGGNSDSSMLFHESGYIGNANGSGTLDYDSRRNALICLMGWNSISSVSLEGLLKTSTPRDSVNVIDVDGVNDFFPTDHVGNSNNRDMYMTWSAGKFFIGITGETLIDPTFTNYMYVAFDLDPEGSNGSTTPPEAAGGVTKLPFRADVVYMIEPYDISDFMIGKVYQWSGTAWTSTEFDGNFASQGALAYAGDMAEFAAIMTETGIGDSFTGINVMAYVAETGIDGAVLSAFPDVNPVGNGAGFDYYFQIDSLAAGIFPTDTSKVKIRGNSVNSVDGNTGLVPEKFVLKQNYPNPFNPVTEIAYAIGKRGKVEIQVFDVTGRQVRNLVNRAQNPGSYSVRFDARELGSGVYFYRLKVDGRQFQTRKMILMK